MAKKIVEAVKKAVTKKPKVVEKKPITCNACGGKGLANAETLCFPCNGSGQV